MNKFTLLLTITLSIVWISQPMEPRGSREISATIGSIYAQKELYINNIKNATNQSIGSTTIGIQNKYEQFSLYIGNYDNKTFARAINQRNESHSFPLSILVQTMPYQKSEAIEFSNLQTKVIQELKLHLQKKECNWCQTNECCIIL